MKRFLTGLAAGALFAAMLPAVAAAANDKNDVGIEFGPQIAGNTAETNA